MDKELNLNTVLITTGIYPPDIGGPATFVPRFGQYLVSNGLGVKLITLSNLVNLKKENNSIQIIRIKRFQIRWVRALKTVFTIARAMRGIDYVFSNGLYLETALAIRFSSFRGNSLVKIVGDPVWERSQNRSAPHDSLFGKLQSVIYLYFGKLERKLITWSLIQFDHVTAPGIELAKSVGSWSNKLNVSVVRNGVKITNENYKGQKRYDLIVVSRLVSWKNVDVAVSIANKLDCSLAVVGDGPQMADLKLQANSNPRVSFLGSCSNDEINVLLRESKVFCQFSDYEGLSFSLLQAMSFSLPCVLSNIEANRDVFKEDSRAAIFVNIQERDEITSLISDLLNSNIQQLDLGNRSRRIVEREFNEKDRMNDMQKFLIKND